MLKVGLTGSIAVGKSFVLSVLAELGGHVIDADEVAREVVQPGTKGLKTVCDAFGKGVLNADGTLNRKQLGSIVFADEAKRMQLNNLLHPLIIAAQDDRIRELQQQDPGGIVIIDAALMIESGGFRRLDKLIVVHCGPEIQLQRLMSRDGLSPEAAEQRINSQMSQEEKKKYADFLIDTSDGFDSTRAQIKALYEQLLTVAASRLSSDK